MVNSFDRMVTKEVIQCEGYKCRTMYDDQQAFILLAVRCGIKQQYGVVTNTGHTVARRGRPNGRTIME